MPLSHVPNLESWSVIANDGRILTLPCANQFRRGTRGYTAEPGATGPTVIVTWVLLIVLNVLNMIRDSGH
jgi:hypothetical protein